MKTKVNKIAEKVVSVLACVMVSVFALIFIVLAFCAAVDAIIERDLFSAIVCACASFIAWFWIDFLRN